MSGKIKVKSRTEIVCQICKAIIKQIKNLKRHLTSCHKDFLNLRKNYESIDYDTSLKITYSNHINGISLDKNLIAQYNRKYLPHYFQTLSKHSNLEFKFNDNTTENVAIACQSTKRDTKFVDDQQDIPCITEPNKDSLPENEKISIKNNRQITLKCHCCSSLDDVLSLYSEILNKNINNIISSKCLCMDKHMCCCKLKAVKMLRDSNEPSKINENLHIKPYLENFMTTATTSKEKTHICKTCFKHSSEGKISGWANKGVAKKKTVDLHDAMKKHINSKEHQLCIKKSESSTSKLLIREKCTENFCTASQFMASNCLPARFYPELCCFLDIICSNISDDNDIVHPLGNRHHAKDSVLKGQKACYDALVEGLKKELNKIFEPTGLQRKFMIAIDKGTSYKDATRQAIIATYINDYGVPEEKLVSVAAIVDQTAAGAKNHLETECSKIIQTRNIAVISTDYASVYVGSESGMVKRIKYDTNFSNKIIYIPDFCHRVERLLFNSKLSWIGETISKSSRIVKDINTHPKVATAIKQYSLETDKIFHAMQPTVTTRYIEYAHIHIKSVLHNIEILSECLPSFIQSDDFDDSAKFILANILNPAFVARAILLNNIFCKISILEKKGQSVGFGPLDYINVVEDLRDTIKTIPDFENSIKQLMTEGKLKYTYYFNKNPHKVDINLKDVRYHLHQTRSTLTDKENFDLIVSDYNKWSKCLLHNFDNFIQIPQAISLAQKMLNEENFKIKVDSFRSFFNIINTEFDKCNKQCLGIDECSCIELEVKKFSDTFSSVYFNCNDHSKAITYFLSKVNIQKIKQLKITNVIRSLEILSLLKGSQSSTERMMSKINKIVRGKYENVYRFGAVPKNNIDRVNVCAFLSLNTNIKNMNPALVRKEFLKSGHLEALMTKQNNKSITIKRKLIGKDSSNRHQTNLHIIKLEVDKPLPPINVKIPSAMEKDQEYFELQNNDEQCDPKPCCIEKAEYCICNGKVNEDLWVGCSQRIKCLSYISRRKQGKDGGDWFHMACVNLKELPSKRTKWLCHLCTVWSHEPTNSKEQLIRQLKKENIKLIKIKGDGNCMFSAFAFHLYGNLNWHEHARKQIYNKLAEIVDDPKFSNLWTFNSWQNQSHENLKPEAQIVEKIVKYYRAYIEPHCKNYALPISKENLKTYIDKKREPAKRADSFKDKFEKYGGSIEIEIFSFIMKADIWLLQPIITKIGDVPYGYKWHKTQQYRQNDDIMNQTICFFYENHLGEESAHYSVIAPINIEKSMTPPSIEKIYKCDE